jgi:enoyl-CoA hydratase/carnithine racemase
MSSILVELPSPTPFIRAWHEGPVGWLMLNRPDKRNALNAAMWSAIPYVMQSLDAAPNIRVIVIRGAGSEAFAAGADIFEFSENRNSAEAAREYEALNGRAFAAIRQATKPVIAMISGFCVGGGLAIALACDMRIAADNAIFALPPARLGLAYPLDGLKDLLAAVPLSVAKELIFTARRLEAKEAKSVGLVDRVVSGAELEPTLTRLCSDIAEGAPLTIRTSKRALDHLAGRPGAVPEDELADLATQCFDSEDYAEGRAAFLEKRKPVFKGR